MATDFDESTGLKPIVAIDTREQQALRFTRLESRIVSLVPQIIRCSGQSGRRQLSEKVWMSLWRVAGSSVLGSSES
jgi:hypothetical protein